MRNYSARYRQYAHGFGRLCHSPEISQLNERISQGLSRRSVLSGLAAVMVGAVVADPDKNMKLIIKDGVIHKNTLAA